MIEDRSLKRNGVNTPRGLERKSRRWAHSWYPPRLISQEIPGLEYMTLKGASTKAQKSHRVTLALWWPGDKSTESRRAGTTYLPQTSGPLLASCQPSGEWGCWSSGMSPHTHQSRSLPSKIRAYHTQRQGPQVLTICVRASPMRDFEPRQGRLRAGNKGERGREHLWGE